MREKLIDIVEDYADFLDWDTKEEMVDSIMEFLATDNNVGCKWVSVKDRLPESGVHILAAVKMDGLYCSGNYVCDAFYAAKYAQSISGYSDECACVYCEEDDEYYLEEGWYEVIKNWDDYNSIVISDTVTHWMPLPQPPKGEENE